MRSPGRLLASLLILAAALPGLLYVSDPPGRDQGVFAYIGWRWLAGDLPYGMGGMEHKGPLPFAAYSLAFLLFGHTIAAARFLAWLALLLAGCGVAWLGRGLGRQGGIDPGRGSATVVTGVLAGVVYLLVAGAGRLSAYWSGAQAETFMEPFVVGTMALAWRAASMGHGSEGGPIVGAPAAEQRRASTRLWLAAGALLGLASLGKPTVILLVPGLIWAMAPRVRGRATAVLAAGFAAPWILTLGYFVVRGGGAALIENVLLANLDYGGRGLALLPRMLPNFARGHGDYLSPLFLVPAAVGLGSLMRRPQPPGARLLVGWVAGAYAEVLVQGRMFGYHYYPVVAPVTLLMSLGLVLAGRHLLGRGGTGRRAPARLAALLVLSLGLTGWAQFPWADLAFRYRHQFKRASEPAFLARFAPPTAPGDVDPAETLRAARWAASNSRPDQTLLVWGFEPAVNFLARRRCPTRFIYDYYLTSGSISPARRERYWRLFWGDLGASPPDWIAVVHNDVNPVEPIDSARQLDKEGELRRYVTEHYLAETQVGDFEFYRRRRPGEAE